MFFVLSKLLAAILFPYPLFFLVGGYVCYQMIAGWQRRTLAVILVGLYVFSTDIFSGSFIGIYEDHYPIKTTEEIKQADAIVVLAGMIHPLSGGDDPEFLGSVDRIIMGEKLLRENKAPYLLISGGTGLALQNGRREARVLRDFLVGRGHPPSQIIAEPDSRNTAENAAEVARIVNERDWDNVILITSAFHMPRSMLCFEKVGVAAQPVPVDFYGSDTISGPGSFLPTPSGLLISTIALKETIGIAAYWMAGYI